MQDFMRNYSVLSTLFLSYICSAQQVSLILERKQQLIQSLPNSIKLLSDDCGNYRLSTNNGRIEQNHKDCTFVIYPDSIATTKITIFNELGQRIAEENYQVKAPEFILSVRGFNENIENLDRFIKSARLSLFSSDLECLNFSWNAAFEFIVLGTSKTRIQANSRNGSLDDLREHFKYLMAGDLVIFHNIKIHIGNTEFDSLDIVLDVL